MPWTAIATIPARAVCSWIASSLRERPGPAHHLAGHRQPEADRDRHQDQRDQAGGAAGQPPAVASGGFPRSSAFTLRSSRNADAGPGGERPDRLDPAVVVDDQAAALGEHLAAALGAGQQRRLGEASPLRPRCRRARWRRSGRSRRARRSPGRAGGGSSGRRSSRQIRTLSPEVATAPEPSLSTKARSPVSGCSTKTSYGLDQRVGRRRSGCRRRSRR